MINGNHETNSPNKKHYKNTPMMHSSHQSILNEIKNSDYNIRIVESPSQNKNLNNLKFKGDIGSKTFYKQNNNKDEEAKFDIGEIKKTDVSSEEFFMRRSQMNYIRKNLSPVKAVTLNNNANFINNNNMLNNSMKRIFSSKVNNHANLIKSDLILLCNLIQKNSNIINYFKHQYQNEVDSTSNKNTKINKNLNISNNSIVSKSSLQNILIQKRCLEIENDNKENFSEIIEKLNDNSKNIELLMNQYKCLVKEELIFKMALENFLNQFLIKKIDDLFFLNNLKNLNDNNEFSNIYSETHSKVQNLKYFLELFNKVYLNKTNERILITNPSSHSIKFNNSDFQNSQTINNAKYGGNLLNKKTTGIESNNFCIYECEHCSKKHKENIQTEDYEKCVVLSSNSIKSIPEENELNETIGNSKFGYSKKNTKNASIKVKRKASGVEEKSLIKFDLIKMQSTSEYHEEDRFNNSIKEMENEEYDSNKILEMKTFAEFKNYETENTILNHIKKLHENMNEKIFKIFYDFFLSKYPNEQEYVKGLNNNSPSPNNKIQRSKTKLRGMLLKKNDDGIMSFLFIREEFEKILKEKEELIDNLTKSNLEIEKELMENKLDFKNLDSQINELKKQMNKKEVEAKFDFIKNLENENKSFLTTISNKLENKMKKIESENVKLHCEIDVLETRINSAEREKNDYKLKLEFFLLKDERHKRKKKLNESYEDVLVEQFENMKRAYVDELERVKKENTLIRLEHKKQITKLEMEMEQLKNRNFLYFRQMEELKNRLIE